MITSAEAASLYSDGTNFKQLAKLDEVIRKVAQKQRSLTLALSGYNREFMAEQEKLWLHFSGLSDSTVEVLKEKGFSVYESNDYQGHS